MNILLLNPYYKKNVFRDPILSRCVGVDSKAPYLWPPIGLAYLASYLKEYNPKILDAQAEKLSLEQTIQKTRNFDLIIINTAMYTINKDLFLAQKIKSNAKIALFGTYATYYHKKFIKKPYIDFIIRGEPEIITKNLIKALHSNNFKKVKGLTWKSKNKIYANPKESLIKDLDKLPFAAVDLLPNEKYYDVLAKTNKATSVITSRGCPYKCNFCSSKYFYGNTYRTKSPERIREEFSYLSKKGFKEIFVLDDTFTINKKHLIKVCSLIKNLNLKWRCESRTDILDKDMLKAMKQAGCYQMKFGVESGSQKILDKMQKGITINQIKKTFKLCHDIGIETIAYFILGYPGENKETIEKTLKLSKELKADFVSFNLFNPIPGSQIFDQLNFDNPNIEELDFKTKSFCEIESNLMQSTLKKAYKQYYLTPTYIINRLKRAKNINDIYNLFTQNIKFWWKQEGQLWDYIKK